MSSMLHQLVVSGPQPHGHQCDIPLPLFLHSGGCLVLSGLNCVFGLMNLHLLGPFSLPDPLQMAQGHLLSNPENVKSSTGLHKK